MHSAPPPLPSPRDAAAHSSLSPLPPYRWLSEEKAERDAARPEQTEADWEEQELQMANWNNGWQAGRLTSSLKDASNAVMRA